MNAESLHLLQQARPAQVPKDASRLVELLFSHLLGYGKLLGQFMAPALGQLLPARKGYGREWIATQCELLRAITVLQDWHDDEPLSGRERTYLHTWKTRLWRHVLDRCHTQQERSLLHLTAERDVVLITQRHLGAQLQKALQRCRLALFPVDAPWYENAGTCLQVREYLERYLACLQIIDDLEDLEQDYLLERPNLFLDSQPRASRHILIERRPELASLALLLVTEELRNLRASAQAGSHFASTFDHGLAYLSELGLDTSVRGYASHKRGSKPVRLLDLEGRRLLIKVREPSTTYRTKISGVSVDSFHRCPAAPKDDFR